MASELRAAANCCEAATLAGRIRGRVRHGIHMFLGVPYGASTGGGRRFQPPDLPIPWVGVRDALERGDQCPQPAVPEPAAWRSWVRDTGRVKTAWC
jgi:para-nitrobenzyl esterase